MAKYLTAAWALVVFLVMCSTGNIITSAAQPTYLSPIPINTNINNTVKPLITVLLDAINSVPLEDDLLSSARGEHEERPRAGKSIECIHINTSDTQQGLQGVSKHQKFATTFFMRPRASFKKLELRMSLGDALGFSEDFYNEKKIDLWSSDVGPLEEWKQVSVEYYKHQVRGFNKHALRVTFGIKNISMVSDYNWLFHDYEGFAIYAKGGAEFMFNCPPEIHRGSQTSRSAGVWLMVGLLVVATLLLAVLLAVWLSLQRKRKRHIREIAPAYPIYDEFDEEVLKKIQTKVEALRGGKSDDVCVVKYGNKDLYPNAFISAQKKEAETEEHLYECPYALIEAQKQKNENLYVEIDTLRKKKREDEKKKEKEEMENKKLEIDENLYDDPYALLETQKKRPEENIYDDPYALVQSRQEKEKETKGKKADRKKAEANYQNIFPTKPHTSSRR